MKKQWFIGLGIVVLTFGIGTAAYANTNHFTKQDMLPLKNQVQQTGQNDDLDNAYKWERVIMGAQIGLIR